MIFYHKKIKSGIIAACLAALFLGSACLSLRTLAADDIDGDEPVQTAEPVGSEAEDPTHRPSDLPATGKPEILDTQGLMADGLTVTVGYFGGEQYTKRFFTMDELEAMADVKQIYSIIDNMPAVCLDAAEGVRITDILEAAGIDVNSVQTFHFFCADVSSTWFTSFSKSYLLDTPRYFYPMLPTNWDYDEAEALPSATDGAVRVDAILALRDKWRRMATTIDFSDLTDTTRCRLLFGQTDVSTIEGSRSAKWVHTLSVTLGGTAPKGVSLSEDYLSLKVGSTYQLSANVEKTDETSDVRVTWSSSDESVAKVDRNGVITMVGEGEAVITVTTVSGGFTASIHVTSEQPEPESTPGQGGDSDSQQPLSPPDGSTGTGGEAQSSPDAPKSGSSVYRIRLGGQTTEDSDSAEQNWRQEQMSGDASELPEAETDPSISRLFSLALLILFCLGAAARIVIYRLEV